MIAKFNFVFAFFFSKFFIAKIDVSGPKDSKNTKKKYKIFKIIKKHFLVLRPQNGPF